MKFDKPLRCLFVLLFCCLAAPMTAQDKFRVDSLLNQLNVLKEIQPRIEVLLALSSEYESTNLKISLRYAQKASALAYESNEIKLQVSALMSESFIYYSLSDLKNAMETALKAKEICEKNDLKLDLAIALDAIGMIYYDIGDKKKCSQYYFQSLKYYEASSYKVGIAKSLSRIGILYLDQKDYKTALGYFNKSLVIAKELNVQDGIASILNNIANIYIGLEDNNKALEILSESLKFSVESKNPNMVASNYVNKGKVYYNLKEYPSALKYDQLALKLFDTLGNLNRQATCHIRIGEVELALKQYDLSLVNASTALKIGTEQGFKQIMYESSQLLHKIYLARNDIVSAYKYTILENQWKDSLALNEKAKNLASLELQYQFDKREQQELAARQRRTIFAVGVIAFLVLGIIIILLILNQLRLKAKKSRLEKISLEKELDFKKKELTFNVMSLMKQNEMLAEISRKIIQIQKEAEHEETRDALKKVGKEIQKSSEDETLKEFSLRFKEVHKDFYDALLHKFPDLTPSELKLCAFLKLNMTTKEISELTGQRLNTLENARYRLRMKLGISNSEVNLVTFLAQI
ncbi:MAG: tetratricopeptide repeat protein [Bacteroidetes bacterium]|nr:tetratricopeptide repeat protein [Bacteroidota bacterium]